MRNLYCIVKNDNDAAVGTENDFVKAGAWK
jgi:hypothetical protein